MVDRHEALVEGIQRLMEEWRREARVSVKAGTKHALGRTDSEHRQFYGQVNTGWTLAECADQLAALLPAEGDGTKHRI